MEDYYADRYLGINEIFDLESMRFSTNKDFLGSKAPIDPN